jgi:Hydrazine synthase alpha subunit middle domain
LVVGQDSGQSRFVTPIWVVGALTIGFVLFLQLPAIPQAAPSPHNISSLASLPDIVFVQTPLLVSGPLTQRFPQGSAIVRFTPSRGTTSLVRLTSGFFAAADPQISFDGAKVLFSGRKAPGDYWQIWEMDLTGEHKRQITKSLQDCLRAAYLPAGEIALTVQDNATSASYLAVVKTDGSQPHRITFGNAPFVLETVLQDGRIIASAPWPLTAPGSSGTPRLLYTLRPDGTALESFRCDHQIKSSQSDAAELSDGSLVFIRTSAADTATSGRLMKFSQGALTETRLGVPENAVARPQQVSENQLVIAKQSVAGAKRGRFDLYLLDLPSGAHTEQLYADPQLSSIQPTPVVSRAIPKHYWNTLDPASATGNLISLNSYTSADVPHGRITTPIARVRVFALDTASGHQHNLGEAPVEADGSFFVKVPANSPVRFVLLDAQGQTIREEHSWIWARPGEQRGCTGCHGDKAVAPDNHWPQTLRRFDTPTPLGETDHGSATTQAR